MKHLREKNEEEEFHTKSIYSPFMLDKLSYNDSST